MSPAPLFARRLALAAIAAALAALLVVPTLASAQTNILEPAVPLASAHLAIAAVAKTDSVHAPVKGRSTPGRATHVFYGVLLAGAALSFNYSIDPDAGGYDDNWNTAAAFPDKGVHALAGFALTTVGVDLGARPWVAAASVCAAGAAFEFSQGYVSKIDIAADCVGAAGAALWRMWRTRANESEGR